LIKAMIERVDAHRFLAEKDGHRLKAVLRERVSKFIREPCG